MAEDTDLFISGALTVSAVVAGILIGMWAVNNAGNMILGSASKSVSNTGPQRRR